MPAAHVFKRFHRDYTQKSDAITGDDDDDDNICMHASVLKIDSVKIQTLFIYEIFDNRCTNPCY